jgi:hypothetical protein
MFTWSYIKVALAGSLGLAGVGALFLFDDPVAGPLARVMAAFWWTVLAVFNQIVAYVLDPVVAVDAAQRGIVALIRVLRASLLLNGYDVGETGDLVDLCVAVPVVPFLRALLWWMDAFISVTVMKVCLSVWVGTWLAASVARFVMWLISFVPGVNGAR